MQVIYRRKMNQVILVGRAKSKPVIKETASKIQLGQLLIEVQKPYSNAEGIYETETFAVTLWRSLVEECVKEINENLPYLSEARFFIGRLLEGKPVYKFYFDYHYYQQQYNYKDM